jgi:acyl-CoA synthetase (AMP-forming)/AMP-acid ligase II
MDLVREVLDSCRRTPAATAIIGSRGEKMTYDELGVRALLIRDRMAAAGLERGDGVLYAVEPSPDAIAIALGVVAAGGVLVLADPGLAPEMLAARLKLARPRWVVAESRLYAITSFAPLRALVRRRGILLPDLRNPLPGWTLRHAYTGRWLPGVPRGAVRLRGLADTPDPVLAKADLDDPAAIIFTSGTTAEPRAVVHTRRSLATGLEIFHGQLPMGPGDVVHTDGLMLGLPALIGGATWSMPAGPELIARRGVTHLYAVPVELANLIDHLGTFPPSVRHILLGSAPAPPGVLRKAIAAAPTAQVLSIYAMTEVLPVALATAQEKLAHLDGDLLGRPLDRVGVRIADDGELYVSGPHLARGYLGQPPHTEVATGDLARIDEDGRIILLGRKKDMILRTGFNIYPSLYEPAVAAQPGVADAAIVGLADPETGDEEVVLAVVPADGFREDRLRGVLPNLIDAGALPDRVAVLPAFPRTGRSQKLDRAALREAVRQTTKPEARQ